MKDNKAKEGENSYLINLATLKSHHFWPVDSKVPSDYEMILCYSIHVQKHWPREPGSL